MIATLFLSFIALLLFGLPVSFAIGLSSLIVIVLDPSLSAKLVITRTIAGMDSFPLMAIPFFVLAGEIMSRSGMTDRIVDFAMAIVGHIRGGLAHVNILANMMTASVSGSVAAGCTATGSILIPAMIREGYKPSFAALLTAFGSMMGPMIPPSIFLIIYGSMANVSIGALFLGGIVPGLLIGLSLFILAGIMLRNEECARPKRAFSGSLVVQTGLRAGWALFMPVIVIGGILAGFMTPTEAAIVAVVYSLFVGFFLQRTLNLAMLRDLVLSSAVFSTNIMLLVAFSSTFGTIMTIGHFDTVMLKWLTGTFEQPWMILGVLILALALVGGLMDEIATALLFVPSVSAIGKALHYDPVHFGVVIVLAILIGAVMPPVATLHFIACSIARIPISAIMSRVGYFLLPIFIVTFLIAYVPVLVTAIPRLVYG
jgi:C4-dicarboxylate transporter DctM subunit